jgi:hypothetical protein
MDVEKVVNMISPPKKNSKNENPHLRTQVLKSEFDGGGKVLLTVHNVNKLHKFIFQMI